MLTIFFVVDGLGLEAHAALLAASLVHHNGGRFAYVGYVPEQHATGLSPDLAALMARLGVALRVMPAKAEPWAKPYPHGNKILAALEKRDGSHGMFLDTDMICLGPLEPEHLMQARGVAVVPEGRRSWGGDLERWARVYGHFGYALPEARVKLSRNRDVMFVPYFNAGMILFPEGRDSGETGFADIWHETAMIIDHKVPVAKKRPWLDQIALPVALQRGGFDYILAAEAWNYSASDRQLKPGEAPLMLHYHRWAHLSDWPSQRAAALGQLRALAGDGLFGRLEALYGGFWG